MTVAQVPPAEARRAVGDGAIVVDVREADEWEALRVPGARWLPLSRLAHGWEALPADRPLLMLCAVGARSQAAAQYLLDHGRDARNVQGGIMAWARLGLPVERGPTAKR